MAGQELIEDDPQGVDIAAGARNVAVIDLLETGVAQGADESARCFLTQRVRVDRERAGLHQPGNPEIEELRLALFRNQNVRRLQISMNDQVLMGEVHRFTDLAKELQPLSHR